jgi:hypothetical protein
VTTLEQGSALEVLERLLGQARGAAREAGELPADFFQGEMLAGICGDLGRMIQQLKEHRGDYGQGSGP